jgi:hypothetical protein
VFLPQRTRLSTKNVCAGHLVKFSLPFPVRDVFANPREPKGGVRVRTIFFSLDVKLKVYNLNVLIIKDLPAVLPLVSRTRISQSWNVDQCVVPVKFAG